MGEEISTTLLATQRTAIQVVICFHPDDIALKDKLIEHLDALRRFEGIAVWDASQVHPGDNWRREVDKAFRRADVAIILISPPLVASDMFHDVELTSLLERHKIDGIKIIPILLRSCEWTIHPVLKRFTVFPRDGMAIASFSDDRRDQAFAEVARELAKVAEGQKISNTIYESSEVRQNTSKDLQWQIPRRQDQQLGENRRIHYWRLASTVVMFMLGDLYLLHSSRTGYRHAGPKSPEHSTPSGASAVAGLPNAKYSAPSSAVPPAGPKSPEHLARSGASAVTGPQDAKYAAPLRAIPFAGHKSPEHSAPSGASAVARPQNAKQSAPLRAVPPVVLKRLGLSAPSGVSAVAGPRDAKYSVPSSASPLAGPKSPEHSVPSGASAIAEPQDAKYSVPSSAVPLAGPKSPEHLTPSTAAPNLKLVSLDVENGQSIDIKLKNSGDDSAFITGVSFLFGPGHILSYGCSPVDYALYHYELDILAGKEKLTVFPNFEEISELTAGNIPQGLQTNLPVDGGADELLEYLNTRKIATETTVMKKAMQVNSKQLNNRSLNEVVYFKDSSYDSFIRLVKVSTSRSKKVMVSQVVPPRGVDRIKIEFAIPKHYFGVCSNLYIFHCYAILHYDGDKELKTPEFKLAFHMSKQPHQERTVDPKHD